MTIGTAAVLMTAVILVGFAVLQIAGSLLILWSLKTLRPEQHLRADILTLQGTVDALEHQVTKLRTRKAGATSAKRRNEEAVQEEEPLPREFEGLTEEDIALFR